ncbi:unnamed protein product, partial [Polarella glacialis]
SPSMSGSGMSEREIEITEGVSVATTRKTLKQALESYGEIEICHMGDRHIGPEQLPWVRFSRKESAEAALEQIQKETIFVDGLLIKANWRTNRSRAPPREKVV